MEDMDVMPLLSCIGESNHLQRKNDKDELTDENTFSGKHILLCCINLPFTEEYDIYFYYDNFVTVCPHDLLTACCDLFFIREDFEMVVVIKPNQLDDYYDSDLFIDISRHLPPWSLVLKFHDSKSREFIFDYLNMDDDDSGGLKCVLVNAEKKFVCQGNYDTLPNVIDHLKELYRECSFDLESPRCYARLLKSMWPVVREEQNKPSWSIRSPIARKFRAQEPEYSHDVIYKVLESRKSCVIEVGKCIDVVSLLCGEGDMNYLVRNNGERVEVEGNVFSGKYVMVCCFHVPAFREHEDTRDIQSIANICYELYSTRTDVEVVVVAKMNKLGDYKMVFDHFLTGFPSLCLAVPFEDSNRRDFICKYLDLGFDPNRRSKSIRRVVLDKDVNDNKRNICVCESPCFLYDYGANTFPFTKEKQKEFEAKDTPRWETPSTSTLEGLLQCSPSDVVYKVNSEGVRVQEMTISELSEKVVGLYMPTWERLIPKVHDLYKKCQTRNLSFEIVLVYVPFDGALDYEANKANLDSILQNLNISLSDWWRLPFNNSVSQRLYRFTYGAEYNEQLITVGPHDENVDPYGMVFMNKSGIDGYPFTREGLVQSRLKKLREFTLESLLVFGSRDYVSREKDKIAVSELKGRSVIVYLDHLGDDLSLFDELLTWYDEIKAKHPSFEVVFVRLDSRSSSSNVEIEDETELSAIMPWLICPFDRDHSASIAKKIFIQEYRQINTLILFGEDGQICTTQAQDLLRKQGPGGFPFSDNLRKEVINEVKYDDYKHQGLCTSLP